MRAPAVLLLLALCVADATRVTPVQKVLQMMVDLHKKATQEKNAEEIAFSKFNQWCTNTESDKVTAIQEAQDEMDAAAATIEQMQINIANLSEEIQNHEIDEDIWNKNTGAITKVRGMEHTDFLATQSDYSESISALRQAITVLAAKVGNVNQSFLQVTGSKLMQKFPVEKRALEAFLQGAGPGADSGAADTEGNTKMQMGGSDGGAVTSLDNEVQPNAYESSAQSIVAILEKLLTKFVDEKRTLEREELESKAAYNNMMTVLAGQIKNSQMAQERKTKERADDMKTKGEAEVTKANATTRRDEDTKYRDELVTMCTARANEFPKRMAVRTAEIDALNQCVDILENKGVRAKEVGNLRETSGDEAARAGGDGGGRTAFSFLQTMTMRAMSPAAEQAMAVLERDAHRLGSQRLAMVAESVIKDPFAKVVKLMKDMIMALKKEATEEAAQEGWCNAELAANKETRQAKTEGVEDCNADIDEIKAMIAQTQEENSQMQDEITEINQSRAEATKQRADDKARNEQTIADNKVAIEAVEECLTILKETYAKAGESTALTQQGPMDDAPPSWDTPYTGEQAAKTGPVAILEQIGEEFQTDLAETEQAEESQESEFKSFIQETDVALAVKNTTIEQNNEKIGRLGEDLEARKVDLENTQKELDAANAYYEKLKPTCVTVPVSYEERVKMREDEIQSLKEAHRILSESADAAGESSGTDNGLV